MERQKCSECGSYSTQCYHADVGGVEYYDEYVLHCEDCGHIEREGRYGGSPMSNNWSTECPYCGVNCYSHRAMPQGLWGYGQRYKPDYKPLFCFDIKRSLGGVTKLCIAEKDNKVILVAYGYSGPQIELDLPVPYNRDSEHTSSSTYDTWNNLSLDFQIIGSQKEQVVIEVTIGSQQGYWYYGSLDDAIPQPVVTKKKLIVSCEGANKPVAKLEALH